MPEYSQFRAEIVETPGKGIGQSVRQYYARRLKYPLDQNDYKAEILFRPFKRESVNFSTIGSTLARYKQEYDAYIAGLDEGLVPDSLETWFASNFGTAVSDQAALEAEQNDAFLGNTFAGPESLTKEYGTTSCSLYLPQAIQFRDQIRYNDMQLGAAGGAALGALTSGGDIAGAAMSGVNQVLRSIVGNPSAAMGSAEARLAAARLSQIGPSFLQGAVRLAGQVSVNPNIRTLFEAPGIREFTFNFKFIPTSASESFEINKIINFFRKEMYPEKIPLGDQGFAVGYEFPSLFDIKMLYNKKILPNTEMLPCYLYGMDVNHNQANQAFYDVGHTGEFNEIEVNLSFREERAPDKADFLNKYDNFDIYQDVVVDAGRPATAEERETFRRAQNNFYNQQIEGEYK